MALFQQGSGVRIWQGQQGVLYHARGEVTLSYGPHVGIDSHLVTDLKLIADTLGLRLWINSSDGGVHAENSRHYRGLAVDCDQIAVAGRALAGVSADNHEARMLVRFLAAQGFLHHEEAPVACVLLGAPFTEFNQTSKPHLHHLHLSLWR